LQIAKEAGQFILENIQNAFVDVQMFIQEQEQVLTRIVNSMEQMLGVQAQGQIADSLSQNINMTAKFQVAAGIDGQLHRPSNLSACHIMQMTLTARNNALADDALVQAFVQANQNGLADPVVNSQVMLNECTLCFAPVYPINEPGERNSWLAMGCQPCADANHSKQDLSVASLLGPDQYLVPPNFPKQLASGVFAMTPKPTDPKYYPFVAAYTYCQHMVPRRNKGPQVTANGGPTIGLLSLGQGLTESSQSSDAATACFRSLVQRMQFDQNNTTWPAGNVNPNATGAGPAGLPGLPNGIVTRHDEQYAQCLEEYGANRLDNGQAIDCSTNGRSELQALNNKMFSNGQASHLINNVWTAPTSSGNDMMSQSDNSTKEWIKLKRDEETQVGAAIAASMPPPGSGSHGPTEQQVQGGP
jgi:hypothetical protein